MIEVTDGDAVRIREQDPIAFLRQKLIFNSFLTKQNGRSPNFKSFLNNFLVIILKLLT